MRLEQGPLSLVTIIEELLEIKSIGGRLLVNALDYKPEGRGFEIR
jgi:hypothetical protein